MTFQEVLESTGIPCVYGRFRKGETPKVPPYIAYIGAGQETFEADNTFYYSQNSWQVEYYFTRKDEAAEAAIERALLENGYLYEKSDDVPVDDEGVYLIYYYV